MITLTDDATTKVGELIAGEGDDSLALRVAVRPGGCSGFKYEMFFDTERADDVLAALPAEGVERVLVVQPGFTTDCLETIDEIGFEYREVFEEAGGKHLYRVPCLNDHPRFIEALAAIVCGQPVPAGA